MEINNRLNLQGCVCLPNYYDGIFAAEEKKLMIGLLNQFHMQLHMRNLPFSIASSNKTNKLFF